MIYGLDTSVILRVITGEPADLAEKVQSRLSAMIENEDRLFVSCLAVSEAYYALQHFYGHTKESTIKALRAMSECDGFVFSDEAKSALDTHDAWKASPGLVDRMIAGEYAARGHKTISCEKDFRKLDFTAVIS